MEGRAGETRVMLDSLAPSARPVTRWLRPLVAVEENCRYAPRSGVDWVGRTKKHARGRGPANDARGGDDESLCEKKKNENYYHCCTDKPRKIGTTNGRWGGVCWWCWRPIDVWRESVLKIQSMHIPPTALEIECVGLGEAGGDGAGGAGRWDDPGIPDAHSSCGAHVDGGDEDCLIGAFGGSLVVS